MSNTFQCSLKGAAVQLNLPVLVQLKQSRHRHIPRTRHKAERQGLPVQSVEGEFRAIPISTDLRLGQRDGTRSCEEAIPEIRLNTRNGTTDVMGLNEIFGDLVLVSLMQKRAG